MTKKEFLNELKKGYTVTIRYSSGKTFQGVVNVKSKEIVVDGLHVTITDISNITKHENKYNTLIKFETENSELCKAELKK